MTEPTLPFAGIAAAAQRARVVVVIPCFNQGRFLGEAIESVLRQSYRDFAIIVVDDGSTDDTPSVAAAYPVRYVRQSRQGLSAARNAGYRLCAADYVVFLDADDRLLSNALETGVAVLDRRPEYAFSSGSYRIIAANGEPLRTVITACRGLTPYHGLLMTNYIGMHATVTYRYTAIEHAGGFRPDLNACEDYDLLLRIARTQPVHHHGTVVADYRQHPENTTRDTALMLRTALAVLRTQRDFVRRQPDLERAYRAGMRLWREYYGALLPRTLWETLHEQGLGRRFASQALAGVRHACGPFLRKCLQVALDRTRRHFGARLLRKRVRFGDLRRTRPIDKHFGFGRGTPIDRRFIEAFLAEHADDVQGCVLEIGDDAYTRRFGASRVSTRKVLDVNPANPRADIVADLTHADEIPSNSFDCVILTQVLQLIYDTRSALRTVQRILKPGGVLLATFPGISGQYDESCRESWYWSFTTRSAWRILGEVFPGSDVEVRSYGNVLSAAAFLYGFAAEDLDEAGLEYTEYSDPAVEMLIAVCARKVPGGPA